VSILLVKIFFSLIVTFPLEIQGVIPLVHLTQFVASLLSVLPCVGFNNIN